MDKNKLNRLINVFTRSLKTWYGMTPVPGGRSEKRRTNPIGMRVTREIDNSMASHKTSLEHSYGRIDAIMTRDPFNGSRFIKIQVGNRYHIAKERTADFDMNVPVETLEQWVKSTLKEELEQWQ